MPPVAFLSSSPIWPLVRAPRALRSSAALALCLLSAPAAAQAPSAQAASAREQADAAFEEARLLLDEGRKKAACEKFELSMSLDPSPGTLLNLGNCYEADDVVRSLATFERALRDAQASPDPVRRERWTEAATSRIADVSKKVPRLTLRAAEETLVLLDGQRVELGAPLRLNPGSHLIEASAPGKRSFSQELRVELGQQLEVEVPALEPLATSAPPPTQSLSEPAPTYRSESQFGALPWVLGGSGALLVGASLVTGLMASSKAGRLEDECTGVAPDGRRQCPDASLEGVQESAQSLALATDVLWITGALAAGAGITLLVLDDGGDTESGTALQTGCFSSGCGLLANGRF